MKFCKHFFLWKKECQCEQQKKTSEQQQQQQFFWCFEHWENIKYHRLVKWCDACVCLNINKQTLWVGNGEKSREFCWRIFSIWIFTTKKKIIQRIFSLSLQPYWHNNFLFFLHLQNNENETLMIILNENIGMMMMMVFLVEFFIEIIMMMIWKVLNIWIFFFLLLLFRMFLFLVIIRIMMADGWREREDKCFMNVVVFNWRYSRKFSRKKI